MPAYPLSPFDTVAHLGPNSMSVEGAALMLNVTSASDARDWTALPPDGRDSTLSATIPCRNLDDVDRRSPRMPRWSAHFWSHVSIVAGRSR